VPADPVEHFLRDISDLPSLRPRPVAQPVERADRVELLAFHDDPNRAFDRHSVL
jgi:hypothetical protein